MSQIQSYSESEQTSPTRASADLKMYQAFIFSVPILFTLILLLLLYLFYLRRQRVDWSALRMRTASLHTRDDFFTCELGLKKEYREMLPIIVFKESFSVNDAQCSVCLADYQAEDRLQQIPSCGHTFHMDCIDLWLATHTTCPLCRLSLVATAKANSSEPSDTPETSHRYPPVENGDISSHQIGHQPCINQEFLDSTNGDARVLEMSSHEAGRDSQFVDNETISEAIK
ncbi:RING-H2 finger protein [Actinidia chinensis var. chinensis]|uniref:RING-type E3 ubiquitin transferase n=1 Tax=Actinidia chinensis var. chinensis TaxID=1590841 RepID=A0A2R6R290_ACTCC|nr:RING-H2 finger protein [Actinidia chinensis var. chinensis]